MRRLAWLGLGALFALLLLLLPIPKLARACGGFFSRAAVPFERRPSLAYEQSLIVFDADKRREHFIREVVFRASKERFGFVVPAPARPEVAKLEASPFAELRAQFPFESPEGIGTIGSGSGRGVPGGAGVRVLEVRKVGSFTAFVLAADDAKALSEWLRKNQLVSTPEADAWLAHYVRLHFFYVAMRYDPPADEQAASGRTQAETVRISFDTPLAYYPYFEPDPPRDAQLTAPRMLEIWLVTKARTVPVSMREQAGTRRWIRPFAEGRRYDHTSREWVEKALGKDKGLLFGGDVLVQRFIDQKRSRKGFGDVLFVPAEKNSPDPDTRAKLATLSPILDPTLAPEPAAAAGP